MTSLTCYVLNLNGDPRRSKTNVKLWEDEHVFLNPEIYNMGRLPQQSGGVDPTPLIEGL